MASTALGSGKYYLVLRPAAHIPAHYAGLYNRFADYQRVVSREGAVLRPRTVDFCPDGESQRVDTIAQAEAQWQSAGNALPIPRRCR